MPDWLCEDVSEADDKTDSMLASIDPEADKGRSPAEGVSGRDRDSACRARNAFASLASDDSGGRRSFSISDVRLDGNERSSFGKNK